MEEGDPDECDVCLEPALVFCVQCAKPYCVECNSRRHAKRPGHHYQRLSQLPTLPKPPQGMLVAV